ncbi:ferritin family protein [Falsibacillus pallidus]|uniref:ferritin family protein n=1 Tax=Falsibacillus pallidus TaxID=493781 RepID=UPI003D96917E
MTFLEKLEKAITDEWKAYHFYKELKTKTNNPLFLEFIEEPMQDEKKHYEMFQYLHYLLTGNYYENEQEKVKFTTFKEGVLMALKDELEAADFYRDMLFELPNQQAYQPLFTAMTDEMNHATRFSTIYNSLK